MWAQFRIEPLHQRLDFSAQYRVARIQQVPAAGLIGMHENPGGVDDSVISMHQYRNGAALTAFHRQPAEQRRVRFLPIGQRDPIQAPARLLAKVAEWDGNEGRGSLAVDHSSSFSRKRHCYRYNRKVPQPSVSLGEFTNKP